MTTSLRNTLFIALGLGLAVAVGFIVWQNFIYDAPKEKDVITKTETKEKIVAKEDTIPTGEVTGSVIYPSHGLPPDYRVCAMDAKTKAEVQCIPEVELTKNKAKFSMKLKPGKYLFVARSGPTKEVREGFGYYDRYMKEIYGTEKDKPGDKQSDDIFCRSEYHTPLEVSVEVDQKTEGIKVGNFYYDANICEGKA